MTRTEAERRVRQWTLAREEAIRVIHSLRPGDTGPAYQEQLARWQKSGASLAILRRRLERER